MTKQNQPEITETVVISIDEYRSLLRQSAFLSTILHAAPAERTAVADAIIRGMGNKKGGAQK